jgi:hypothetical protein
MAAIIPLVLAAVSILQKSQAEKDAQRDSLSSTLNKLNQAHADTYDGPNYGKFVSEMVQNDRARQRGSQNNIGSVIQLAGGLGDALSDNSWSGQTPVEAGGSNVAGASSTMADAAPMTGMASAAGSAGVKSAFDNSAFNDWMRTSGLRGNAATSIGSNGRDPWKVADGDDLELW